MVVHLAPSVDQVQQFILHEGAQGKTSEAAQGARWDHLKWWSVREGAPGDVQQWRRPLRMVQSGGVKESQAVAADPAVQPQMEGSEALPDL